MYCTMWSLLGRVFANRHGKPLCLVILILTTLCSLSPPLQWTDWLWQNLHHDWWVTVSFEHHVVQMWCKFHVFCRSNSRGFWFIHTWAEGNHSTRIWVPLQSHQQREREGVMCGVCVLYVGFLVCFTVSFCSFSSVFLASMLWTCFSIVMSTCTHWCEVKSPTQFCGICVLCCILHYVCLTPNLPLSLPFPPSSSFPSLPLSPSLSLLLLPCSVVNWWSFCASVHFWKSTMSRSLTF